MRTTAGLHSDNTSWHFGKELRNGIPSQRLTQNDIVLRIHTMNLKNVFRQIKAYPNDLHDTSPSVFLTSEASPLGGAGSIPLLRFDVIRENVLVFG